MIKNSRRKIFLILISSVLILLLFAIVFAIKPKHIQQTMNGIILNKETKKMVGKTSITIDVRRKRSSGGFSYQGRMEIQHLNYSKENEVIFSYSEETKMIQSARYFRSIKKEGSYVTHTDLLNLSIADPDLSKFVITDYNEDSILDSEGNDTLIYNGEDIMVFPAETEQEALEILEGFSEYQDLYKVTTRDYDSEE